MNIPLIINLTLQDFRDRYAGSIFGVVWALIGPLVMIGVYLIVFTEIMGSRLAGTSNLSSFSIFLISGLLPWLTFTSTVMRTSSSFIDKKPIITKIRVDLSLFLCHISLSEFITLLVSVGIFTAIYVHLLNEKISIYLLINLFCLLLVQQIFAYAIGVIFGVVNVFYRDVREFLSIFLNIWFWMTPIVWVPSIAPQWLQSLQSDVNPYFWFLEEYRGIFLHANVSQLDKFLFLMIISFVVFTASIFFVKSLEKEIRDHL
tara:strand:+ start:1205 stop:1981 length:777 start_codon:yes stop_codon:yes gene_type:complete